MAHSDTMESGDLAPVIVTIVIMMIPIVAILTNHQRKMAEIIHGRRGNPDDRDEAIHSLANSVSQLNSDLQELRQIVAQQIINTDRLPRTGEEDFRPRIGGG